MLAKIFREHQDDGNLHELRRLKLSRSGQSNPRAMAIDPHPYARHQDRHQANEAEQVKQWRNFDQAAVVAERNREHRDQSDAKSNQLLLPESFRGLRVVNLPRAKADDAYGQQGHEPIEISNLAFLNNGNHLLSGTHVSGGPAGRLRTNQRILNAILFFGASGCGRVFA